MKLSRRKMFGAAIGGAIAGPDVAKAAIQRTTFMFPPVPTPTNRIFDEVGAKVAADQNWTMEQLARFKRIAAGDIRDEDRNYPAEGNPEPFRALKSVSENARHFMRTSLYERQWRERTIKSALDALDHYDETGILRSFF